MADSSKYKIYLKERTNQEGKPYLTGYATYKGSPINSVVGGEVTEVHKETIEGKKYSYRRIVLKFGMSESRKKDDLEETALFLRLSENDKGLGAKTEFFIDSEEAFHNGVVVDLLGLIIPVGGFISNDTVTDSRGEEVKLITLKFDEYSYLRMKDEKKETIKLFSPDELTEEELDTIKANQFKFFDEFISDFAKGAANDK